MSPGPAAGIYIMLPLDFFYNETVKSVKRGIGKWKTRWTSMLDDSTIVTESLLNNATSSAISFISAKRKAIEDNPYHSATKFTLRQFKIIGGRFVYHLLVCDDS